MFFFNLISNRNTTKSIYNPKIIIKGAFIFIRNKISDKGVKEIENALENLNKLNDINLIFGFYIIWITYLILEYNILFKAF